MRKIENQKITLMMSVGRLHREWRNHMRKCALEVGIPDSYRMIIMYLTKNPGANQKALAEFASKTTAAINQTVKEMEQNGYIRKETDENDMRFTKLFLTQKGIEKSEKLLERLHQSDKLIAEKMGISEDEENQLIDFLGKIKDIVKGEL